MVVYLATAPKSNSSKVALGAAMEAARQHPAEGVPMHIRNAPTKLMKELGYHAGYQYAHDAPEAYIPQEYLPDKLHGARFYEPGPYGFEKEIASKDLPNAVRDAIEVKYPKSTIKLAEEVVKVKDGKEKLEFYEAIVDTADKKSFELQVASDGKIIKTEDKSEKKD